MKLFKVWSIDDPFGEDIEIVEYVAARSMLEVVENNPEAFKVKQKLDNIRVLNLKY
ncbi:hypothetical protein LCGC14_1042750 [marine sediment metagenome]|uniref:Uncharacterized protein n=1 Tax=marine sediment metagenome TaxID=412755 RepID=A0A0F9MR80_9ZZZZ